MGIRSVDVEVAYLDGYLKALERIVDPQRKKGVAFSAGYFLAEDHLEGSLQKYMDGWGKRFRLVGYQFVHRPQVRELWQERLFSHLADLGLKAVRELDWQLEEYYGVIACSENVNPGYDPLFKEPMILMDVDGSDGESWKIFAIRIGRYWITTSFGDFPAHRAGSLEAQN